MTTIKLLGVAVLCGAFTGLRGGLFSLAMWRLNVRIRQELFKSLLTQEVGFYDTAQTGAVGVLGCGFLGLGCECLCEGVHPCGCAVEHQQAVVADTPETHLDLRAPYTQHSACMRGCRGVSLVCPRLVVAGRIAPEHTLLVFFSSFFVSTGCRGDQQPTVSRHHDCVRCHQPQPQCACAQRHTGESTKVDVFFSSVGRGGGGNSWPHRNSRANPSAKVATCHIHGCWHIVFWLPRIVTRHCTLARPCCLLLAARRL